MPIKRSDFRPSEENEIDYVHSGSNATASGDAASHIHRLLTATVRKGMPEMPVEGTASLEALFTSAQRSIDSAWNESGAAQYLEQRLRHWKQQLGKDHPDLVEALTPENIYRAIAHQDMGVLEGLRSALPEAWQTLLRITSVRQLSVAVLLRHWNEHLPDDAFKNFGLKKKELGLYLELAARLGKFFDEAYFKQMEI